MGPKRIKHLELIQNIITRMNNNSFQIKNWSVITISAIFTILISQKNFYFLLVTLLPISLFWFLDAYYLMQERKFRGLYNKVLHGDKDLKLFEMNTNSFNGNQYRYCKALISKTIWNFYITMIIIIIVLLFCLIQIKGGEL